MRVLPFCLVATAAAVGPVEKVVQLLTQLKKQVHADQDIESKAFEEQDKWCRSTVKDKEFAIETATSKIEDATACIEEKTGITFAKSSLIQELGSKIAVLEGDIQAAKKIREDESKAFSAADAELSSTIDTLERAVVILKRSGVGKTAQAMAQLKQRLGLLVTTLSTVINASWVPRQSRAKIQELLQNQDIDFENPQASAYEGHSSGIIDLLGDLRDKADEAQRDARKEEMESKHSFDMLVQDATNEIGFAKKGLAEAQRVRSNAEEAKARCDEEKASNQKSLKDDSEYLAQLKVTCQMQADQFVRNTDSRAAEVETIEKAIEVLTGEGAQAALGRLGTSFIQTPSDGNMRQAQKLLGSLGKKLHSVALTQVAYRLMSADPSDPFGKVKGMISEMIARLEKEALEEATHKAWCDDETTKNKAAIGKSTARLSQLTNRIEKNAADIAMLTEDARQLEKEIAQIDAEQAEAIKIRTDNKAANAQQLKDAEDAEASVAQAMVILRNYYSGKSSEAAEEFVQKGKLPTAVVARDYSENANGVNNIIGILEVAQSEFLNVATETRALEEEQSNDFRDLTNKNKVSRATKVAQVKGKRAEIKSIQNSKNASESDLNNEQDNYDALTEYKDKLQQSCEYSVPSFEERASQRKAEIEGLKQALDILNGDSVATDDSFVEKARVLRGAKRH